MGKCKIHFAFKVEMLSVGPPGIEPGLYEPESYVLPAYSGPTQNTSRVVTDTFLAAARKVSRPRLAVSPTGSTWLRLAPMYKTQSSLLFVYWCALQDSNLRPSACEADALTS